MDKPIARTCDGGIVIDDEPCSVCGATVGDLCKLIWEEEEGSDGNQTKGDGIHEGCV